VLDGGTPDAAAGVGAGVRAESKGGSGAGGAGLEEASATSTLTATFATTAALGSGAPPACGVAAGRWMRISTPKRRKVVGWAPQGGT